MTKLRFKVPGILFLAVLSLWFFVSAGGREGRPAQEAARQSTLSANDRLPSIISYPLKNAAPITYWMPLSTHVAASYTSINESPFAAGLIERTGINVSFIHPAIGMENEQFGLLLASGRMPDVVEYSWFSAYIGGPDAAIRNRLMLPLNAVMDRWAPDFRAFLGEYPRIEKMVKTDADNYYGFPMVLIEEPLLTTGGPIIRQDWLDELGFRRPETIDELTVVLRAFKEHKGASAPMVLLGGNSLANIFFHGAIAGAYRTFPDMYVEGGRVKYGPAEEGYKRLVAQMHEWYREGLLDKSFASNTIRERDAYILAGNSGVTFGFCANTMDMLNRAFRDIDPAARLRGFRYPSLERGGRAMFGQRRFNVDVATIAAVNPRSPNTESAVKFLNYAYTKAGYYYYNFGIEGTSYTMTNGSPRMIPAILDPPSGSMGQAWGRYARAIYNGPFRQSYDFLTQYLSAPEHREALSLWAATDAALHQLPPITITVEESRAYNRIKTELNAYVLEWTTLAISGATNIAEFDTVYQRTLRDIGLTQAITIQQAAYDRYEKR